MNTCKPCKIIFSINLEITAVYLFNLAEDPYETTDLAPDPQYADILEIMKDRLQVNLFD